METVFVVLASVKMAYNDKDSILDQKYSRKIFLIFIMEILKFIKNYSTL